MEEITNEVLATMNKQKQRPVELQANQDEITEALMKLEKEFDAGNVTQDELDIQLEVLIPRHERLQQEIALAFAEMESLRQRILNGRQHFF